MSVVRRLVPVRRAAASRPPAALPESALPPLTTSHARATFLDERGAATAEYAIATMATVDPKRHI